MAPTIASTVQLPFFADVPDQNGAQARQPAHDPDFDLHFLALAQLKGLGLNSIQALIEHFPDLGSVWRENPAIISDVLHRARISAHHQLADEIINAQPRLLTEGRELRAYLAQRNIRVLPFTHPHFPRRLRTIPDGPLWLFAEGDASVMNAGPFVAIVGTRKPSELGVATASQVTYLAAKVGIGLVSGLAEGIDAAAHAMAGRYAVPQVAVLGTGINITFPTSTASIRRRIVDTGGCVITEYLPNDNYGKSRFVQRNRIQAGLAEAVCPVEGRSSSGTMHTVRFATKYERKLFGVTRGEPGPENDMPHTLAAMDSPVFDLETDEGKAELARYFQQFPQPRFPAPDRPNPEFAFRNVLKAIDTVASYDELTHDDKLYLLEQFRRRLGLERA